MKGQEKPTRLFDIAVQRASRKPRKTCFRYGRHELTSEEYIHNSDHVSRWLLAHGLRRGEAVAIISDNRPEWNIVDVGVMQAGGVLLPLCKGLSAEEYIECLSHAQVRTIFIEDEELMSRFRLLLPQVASVQNVVLIEGSSEALTLERMLDDSCSQDDVANIDRRRNMVTTDDVCTLVYTGGGTYSKLTHRTFLDEIAAFTSAAARNLHNAINDNALCTRYGRTRNYAYQMLGSTVCYPVR